MKIKNLLDKNIYELNFPDEAEKILNIRIECPLISGENGSASQINKYYDKKTKRAISYYKSSSKKLQKRLSRKGGENLLEFYPTDIAISFETTSDNESVLSILSCINAFNSSFSEKRFYSEIWDLTSGKMLTLDDFIDNSSKGKKHLLNYIYSYLKTSRIETEKRLKSKLNRYFSEDNIYIKDDTLYIFYQPGEIAPKKYGKIDIPIDIASLIESTAKQKSGKKQRGQ